MNRKGFTLIELAIVLVIIGIILGAVLKGQDIIRNARAKKLIAQVQKWEAFTWSFVDQKGRFPGDTDKDGVMDDTSPTTEILDENYTNPPTTSIKLGSTTFYVKMGYDGNDTTPHNLIALCTTSDCDSALGADGAKYAEFVDTSIDGEANATGGMVRAGSDITVSDNKVTAATASGNYTDAEAILYFFDKKP
ncbi:prepilin-type N-terminal cleavage/methylation domain-containing protein [Candidatus Aerophobetes bacterium]|nr:prepilin-type N-terminal cleavage/methylation domain-containing protein [Candidatus Aerophobetes bacterium]